MSHGIEVQRGGSECARPVCEGSQASSDVQATEPVVPSRRLAVGKLIRDDGVNVVWASPGASVQQSETETILGFLQQMYDAMKAIVDNLKPSDRELENKRRRMEEIKELRELLLARKIDFEEARRQFVNLLDHEDVAELGKLADREARKIMA